MVMLPDKLESGIYDNYSNVTPFRAIGTNKAKKNLEIAYRL